MRDSQGAGEALELLSTPDAAAFLGVDPSTLKGWPVPYRQVGARGRRRYARADLVAFLERARVTPPARP